MEDVFQRHFSFSKSRLCFSEIFPEIFLLETLLSVEMFFR